MLSAFQFLTHSAAAGEINVSLFGQPCQLSGAYPESVLSSIHEISPEKVPPSLSLADGQRAQEKLKAVKDLPDALEPYRTRLLKRIAAQIAFQSELDLAVKSGKNTGLLSLAKAHAQPIKRNEAQKALRKLTTPEKLRASGEARDLIVQAFEGAIEPHPEEEFHRVLKRIGVQYICHFEDESAETEPIAEDGSADGS